MSGNFAVFILRSPQLDLWSFYNYKSMNREKVFFILGGGVMQYEFIILFYCFGIIQDIIYSLISLDRFKDTSDFNILLPAVFLNLSSMWFWYILLSFIQLNTHLDKFVWAGMIFIMKFYLGSLTKIHIKEIWN